AYFTTLAKPGNQFEEVGSAAFEIAKMIGGAFFSSVFIAGLVIGQLASGLAAQASASRLIFAMGRDGVLPKGLFAKLNDAYKTPVPAIIAVGIVGLLALQLDIATSTSFISFGAFTAFTLVNISVIAYYLKNRSSDKNILGWVLIPIVGAVVDAYLLWQLDDNAKRLGLIWLGLGILILLGITKGLRQKPPAMHGAVARKYGVFNEERGLALRGTFIIDKAGIVRWSVINSPAEARKIEDYRSALASL
ncbi:MAG: amino acid permease, partial [Actinobacteria bacterium]|nr:amino acid permease [Actinomycetota bacterium]